MDTEDTNSKPEQENDRVDSHDDSYLEEPAEPMTTEPILVRAKESTEKTKDENVDPPNEATAGEQTSEPTPAAQPYEDNYTPIIKAQNVVVIQSPFRERNKKNEKEDDIFKEFSIPSNFPEKIAEAIVASPNVDLDKLDKETTSREWVQHLRDGNLMAYTDGFLADRVSDPNADISQGVSLGDKMLMADTPKLIKPSNQVLEGERARLHFANFTGLGTQKRFPLWHSGFYITLKTPPEIMLLELYSKLATEKLALGKVSGGHILGNESVFLAAEYIDFAIKCIYNYSIKLDGDKDLLDYIKITDYHTLIWATAATYWSSGVDYARACSYNPDRCRHVVHERIDLSLLQWVDRTRLTPWQINHMGNRSKDSVTTEEVDRYSREFTVGGTREVKLTMNGREFTITLSVPSLRKYIRVGDNWVNGIINTVNSSLTDESDQNKRNAQLINSSKSTSMCYYAHFVEKIDFDDNEVKDDQTIIDLLSDCSRDDVVREKFLSEVKKFIEDSTFSYIAIPSYHCPACGKENVMEGVDKGKPSIIPIDPVTAFFILAARRAAWVTMR